MAQTGQPAPLQGKSLACDARTWGAAFRGWAGPLSWHPWLLKRGLAVGGGPALKAGEVPRETGSETRPPRCYWGCRERQARAPCLGPRPTTRAGFPGQEQRRPLLQADCGFRRAGRAAPLLLLAFSSPGNPVSSFPGASRV